VAAEAWFALGGAAVGGLPATIKTVLDWRTARTDREHNAAEKLRDDRRAQITRWQEGLAAAAADYQLWYIGRYGTETSGRTVTVSATEPLDTPNASITAWFADLRQYLQTSGPAAEYRVADEIHCDATTVKVLQVEISRIETEWLGGA